MIDDDVLPSPGLQERHVWIVSIVATLVVVAVLLLWPGRGLPLARIRKNPKAYDGLRVTVRGRVGDVFAVGASHAFYLLQGRDTIVVMSRFREPTPKQTVTVMGQVSMGYMDGRPRPAIFELDPKGSQ